MFDAERDPFKLIQELTEIGIALSAERNHSRLLEMILEQAERITNADGGTLYSLTEDNKLKFEIMHTESLGIRMGGTSGTEVPFPPIALYDAHGRPNQKMVAAHAAVARQTINIEDAYTSRDFDFSGTRTFDSRTGYRSKSFLTVPMMNHENELIGVLQLLNCRNPQTLEVQPFSSLHQKLVESLASQAAVTVTNRSLIEAQRELFDSFIQLIADAIDEKSPYTAGHCRRVPVLTDMLAQAACDTRSGPLRGFTMTEAERYELRVAAWLHDCGKITTPEWVVDKSTKLETIFDRVHLVDARFEILKRDAELAHLRRLLARYGDDGARVRPELEAECAVLDMEREFVRSCNVGGEFIADEQKREIERIAKRRYRGSDGTEQPLLTEEEVYNLQIGRGTLTHEERDIIANHVTVTIKMLESLPYPKHLRRVPEYAGGHHERMDGTGYPKGLTREKMSIPARMVAIADIFEALTAQDRPYKKPMPLSQALKILGRMRLDNHVDGDLFDVFLKQGVHLAYAHKFLRPEQIDELDLAGIPGFRPFGAG
jgi:HD-GYP domain-containing protein (c-di-GMP phosphodiesterase class II)